MSLIFPNRMAFKTKAITCIQWFALVSINIIGVTILIMLLKMAITMVLS